MRWHGAAVVGAVVVVAGDQFRVASHEAGAQAGQIGALGQAVEDHAARLAEAGVGRGLQQARRRRGFVAVDLRIAFVRRHHEIVLVGAPHEGRKLRFAKHLAARIARIADVHQFGIAPDFLRHALEIRRARRLHVVWRRAAQERRALVDLIERIGHQHAAAGAAAEHRLAEGEERFPGAVHRQHLGGGVHRDAEAPPQPRGNRAAQLFAAARWRIGGEAAPQFAGFGKRRHHEIRRGVLRLADGERRARMARIRRQAVEQRVQALEGIRLQALEVRIHDARL